jgi:hypothetical protein
VIPRVPHADKNWSAKLALTINRTVLPYRADARRLVPKISAKTTHPKQP